MTRICSNTDIPESIDLPEINLAGLDPGGDISAVLWTDDYSLLNAISIYVAPMTHLATYEGYTDESGRTRLRLTYEGEDTGGDIRSGETATNFDGAATHHADPTTFVSPSSRFIDHATGGHAFSPTGGHSR